LKELKGVTWFKLASEEEGETVTKCQNFWRKIVPRGREGFPTKFFWILSISSNAIVVIVTAIMAYACDPVLPETKSRNTRFRIIDISLLYLQITSKILIKRFFVENGLRQLLIQILH
jgi:hypothetical protein